MGRTSLRTRDVADFATALDRLYQSASPADFPNHLFGVLAELLPGMITSFDFVDLRTGKVESHVMPEADKIVPIAESEAAVREFAWQNPTVSYLASGRPRELIQPTDLITRQQFQRTDFYQLALRPLGIKHQLVAGLAWPGSAGGFVVNKTALRPFTEREVELVRLLRPHVERAHTNAHLIADLRRQARTQPALTTEPTARKAWMHAGSLTARETEVLRWLAVGKRDNEIARILGVSPHTVHSHVAKILAKLKVETRTAAAAIAHQLFAL